MSAQLFGAIFLAGIPSAGLCYYLCNSKLNNRPIGILGAIACFFASLFGGLIYAVPVMLLCLAFAKVTQNPKESSSSTEYKNEKHETIQDSNILKLEKLHDLKVKGVISDEEYIEEKKKLLAS